MYRYTLEIVSVEMLALNTQPPEEAAQTSHVERKEKEITACQSSA
jgi:hypothetical protein